ncbi:MAG: KamA family radical SAM protein [Desulfobacteraceae bacterium]|nr:KamA family radical SAM protein [Desulfobacteraceae bacterium]
MKKGASDKEDFEPPGSVPGAVEDGLDSIGRENAKIIPMRKEPPVPKFRYTARSSAFHKQFFPHTTLEEWNDWRWQLQNRIRDLHTLSVILRLSEDERNAVDGLSNQLPLSITPYYASLIEKNNPSQPLRRTVVPVTAENLLSPGEAIDPLGEEHSSPVPGLVHRYPDRVLFLVTGYCSTYCRYCTRSRKIGNGETSAHNRAQWQEAIRYIERTPSVRDVLISGGDPLILSEENLEWLLRRLRRIDHVELLRIGTKVPVVLPQRITPSLTRILKKYHPLWMSIHFTHYQELTPEVTQACERLVNAGIPLGSQTVLLAGINDDVETMKKLVHGLLKIRVKPYYLYQCDPIIGSSHFRTPVEKGLEIIRGLRGYTTGYAVPTYVIDAPGGGGKIPLLPESVLGRDGDDLLLLNYKGDLYRYPDFRGRVGA